MSLTLLLGGARSGKTSYAERLAANGDRVVYLATAPRIDGDDDLADRIARHRRTRPSHWHTVEEEIDLVAALDGITADVVIVDCLTTWTANTMHAGWDDAHIVATAERVAGEIALDRDVIAVSNEVGLGVHPTTELGRRFRDVLGFVNQRWAEAADSALLMVAGRALALERLENLQ